jgi:hypothetical protein
MKKIIIDIDLNSNQSILYAEVKKRNLENKGFNLIETLNKGFDKYQLIYKK